MAPSPPALATARAAGASGRAAPHLCLRHRSGAARAGQRRARHRRPDVSAPATAVEKSTVTVTVAGLGAGEAGCVSLGSVAKPVVGTGADVTVTFDLPAGAATNTFTLTTLAGSQTAVTSSTRRRWSHRADDEPRRPGPRPGPCRRRPPRSER